MNSNAEVQEFRVVLMEMSCEAFLRQGRLVLRRSAWPSGEGRLEGRRLSRQAPAAGGLGLAAEAGVPAAAEEGDGNGNGDAEKEAAEELIGCLALLGNLFELVEKVAHGGS